MRIVLASASPQRRRILADIGLEFDVRATDVAEVSDGEPEQVAIGNAIAKARAAAAVGSGPELVIGCDTVVATEEGLWGKPCGEADARRTLGHLAGRSHDVVSGLAVVDGGDIRTAVERTRVVFRALSEADLDRYLATGEWQGRAGGYAIQGTGASLIERVEGDLLNVIGLPVSALLALEPRLRVS